MKDIHAGLPERQFVEPEGIIAMDVSARSGLLPSANYTGPTIEEVFIAGTQPTEFDRMEQFERDQAPVLVDRLRTGVQNASFSLDGGPAPNRPSFDLSLDTGGFGLGDPLDTSIDDDYNDESQSSDSQDDAAEADDAPGDSGIDTDFGVNPLLD
jgi:penicillin-binding protein 1A